MVSSSSQIIDLIFILVVNAVGLMKRERAKANTKRIFLACLVLVVGSCFRSSAAELMHNIDVYASFPPHIAIFFAYPNK